MIEFERMFGITCEDSANVGRTIWIRGNYDGKCNMVSFRIEFGRQTLIYQGG